MHEFPISYSHTEWYLPFSLGEIIIALAKASPIKIKLTKLTRSKIRLSKINYNNNNVDTNYKANLIVCELNTISVVQIASIPARRDVTHVPIPLPSSQTHKSHTPTDATAAELGQVSPGPCSVSRAVAFYIRWQSRARVGSLGYTVYQPVMWDMTE